jgi:hypothetical protein
MTTREVRAAPAARSSAAAMPGIRVVSFAMCVLLLVQYGLGLILTGLAIVVRAAVARHGGIIALAAAGLAAMTSAAFNGTRFAGSGQNGDSMAMALTWAVALLCYLSILFIAGRNRSPQR